MQATATKKHPGPSNKIKDWKCWEMISKCNGVSWPSWCQGGIPKCATAGTEDSRTTPRKAGRKRTTSFLSNLLTIWATIGRKSPSTLQVIFYSFVEKTCKQIKEHYMNYLRPDINKEEWTLEEDLKLVECLNKFGKNWKVIEQKF